MSRQRIKAVVMGASWGGLEAYSTVLSRLPATLPVPVLLVQHQHPTAGDKLPWLLDTRTAMRVMRAMDKAALEPGCVYVAPPGYHMLVDNDHTLCYSLAPPVNYSRPSIDELFFSAGHVYGRGLLSVILTGANDDGAAGTRYIKQRGGITVAQSPQTAEAVIMPQAAIDTGCVDWTGDLVQIGDFVVEQVFGLQE
ncbi:chemotaxis protein CheB [Alcanivorax quisquiliarum]|uniref:protein-glutamate methylesterase n=1 Tax=Alcanivorax quisquiliarum TaxID=2933565 RepID=A0ABT0E3G3_9GAMM|nr:chemotaxis protein CheB [Alcanivorax quisquiliarum]MCK0536313.1 chemotaxis protein CheB [Alcanivorax quisquiliarum]